MGNNCTCYATNEHTKINHAVHIKLNKKQFVESNNWEEQNNAWDQIEEIASRNKNMHFKSVMTMKGLGCDTPYEEDQNMNLKESSKIREEFSPLKFLVPASGRTSKLKKPAQFSVNDSEIITEKKQRKRQQSVSLKGNHPKPTTFLGYYDKPTSAHVFLKGELDKYHPGFKKMFVKRVCEASTESFFYFLSDYEYYCRQPLVKIRLCDIEKVTKVDEEFKEKKYQFEIILKPGCKINQVNPRPCSELPEFFIKPTSTVPTIERIKNHTRLIKVEQERFLPRPLLKDRFVKESVKQKSFSFLPRKTVEYQGIVFPNEIIKKEYIRFLNMNKKDLLTIPAKKKISVKSPKKCKGNIDSPNTWNNRELEWYYAESKLLFSTSSLQQCDTWVCLLNFLLIYYDKNIQEI